MCMAMILHAGPIAFLPIGDNYSNIVCTMSPKDASNHKTMNQNHFIKSINHALHADGDGDGDVISSLFFKLDVTSSSSSAPPKVVKLVSERMAFPISLMHANDYVANRVVLIGDAAHTVHLFPMLLLMVLRWGLILVR